MSKIGLITIHDTVNYGSLLQTYATCRMLRQLGHDAELIDYRCEAIEKREKVPTLKNCRSLKDVARYVCWGRALSRKYRNMWRFMRENMTVSRPYTRESIAEANRDYDTFVVGSDIVWSKRITGGDDTYYLDFAADEKRKIAFSSSVGTIWEERDRPHVEKLLRRFDRISVREWMAAQWIRDLYGIEADTTCDPTMLFDGDFWRGHAEKTADGKGGYVLIYAVNQDRKNILDGIRYAKEHGREALFINFYAPVPGTKTVRPDTPGQWLSLFLNADTVFSASYHGLLFSLYFRKNVFFYNGRGETSRMISLAEETGIRHREGTEENLRADAPIDFDEVDRVLAEKRAASIAILKRNLEG